MFTFQAMKFKKMSIFGGNQIRPNIHINDIVNVFFHFLQNPEIKSGAYNAGFENIKILDIAEHVHRIPAIPVNFRENLDEK